MPSERQMWEVLRPVLAKAGLDPVRVENPALPGTPDVNYVEGWVELKHADRWPPKGGPLQLSHPPTPEQRTWLLRRWHQGGRAFLCLRVGQEWFLFNGDVAAGLWSEQRAAPPAQAELRASAALVTRSKGALLPLLTAERFKA